MSTLSRPPSTLSSLLAVRSAGGRLMARRCFGTNYQRLPNVLDKTCLKWQLDRSGFHAINLWKCTTFSYVVSYAELVSKCDARVCG